MLDIRPLHALQISPDLHDIPCPDFGHASSWSLGLRVLAGIGQPGRAWESVEGERVEYLAHRDSSEQLRFHPTAGLRLEAYHPSGFFVRAGLDYLMERSQVSSQGPTTTTKNIVEVRDPISERVIRVDTTTTITYTQLTTQNRQHRLALVGGLGYRLPGFRLRPYVVAEVGYGLLLHSRGRLPRPGIDSEELSLVSPYLRRSPGLQFGGIVGVDLPVDAHWAIGLNVHYTRLGTIRGAGDPLNYSQLTRGAALNLVYRPQ